MGFRVNSTGRKRILREHIRINLIDQGGGQPPAFTADISLPSELKLDPAARVYVEPYVKTSTMRFSFGTVAALKPPERCVLTDIDAGASVLFRVKVVDETAEIGRILASANGIRPEDDADGDDRRPLLPVKSENLGEEIWQLQIDRDIGPTLVVNSRVPDLIESMKRDVLFQAVIYPEVVRQLVREVFSTESEFDEEAEWIADWKGWFAGQVGRDIDDFEAEDADAVESLADDIAAKFASKCRFASSLIATRRAAS